MDSSNRKNVKLLAAVIGGSAMVTMGALTMSIHQQAGTDNVAMKGMTLGATTSTTPVATVAATSVAVPGIKGAAPFKATAP